MSVWEWFTDPANWTGSNGVPARLIQHLAISAAAMGLALLVSLPLGVMLGHLRRAGFLATTLGSLGRAVPTLAILVILASIPAIGVGNMAAVLALAVFAIPPVLTGSYVAVRDVDPVVRDAARGMGLTGGQLLRRVELPLATPGIAASVRTAIVQVVATVALAALVGSGGLGRYVVDGFARQDVTLVAVGAILCAVVAMSADLGLGALVDRTNRRGTPEAGHEPTPEISRVPGSRSRPTGRSSLAWLGAYAAAIMVLAGSAAVAGGSAPPGQLTIAAFNFGESTVMANLYAGVLRDAGIDVGVSSLSTREVISPALESGAVDVVPEYLGTYTEFLNKQVNGPDAAAVASSDLAATLSAGRGLAVPLGITLAEPSPAADQNAFAVTADFAREHGLTTVSQLAALSQDKDIVLGGPPECPTRPFCLPGLENVYGARIAEFVPLDAGGPLTKQALAQGAIDVGLVFSSDGGVEALDLQVLADDKALQTVDNLTPALSQRAATPDVIAVLNRLSGELTTEDLVAMNRAVDIDREDPVEVANNYLTTHSLVGTG